MTSVKDLVSSFLPRLRGRAAAKADLTPTPPHLAAALPKMSASNPLAAHKPKPPSGDDYASNM